MKLLALLLAMSLAASAQRHEGDALTTHILGSNETRVDTQVWLASRIPLLPVPQSRGSWETYARSLRERILDRVVYRGEARSWREERVQVEYVGEVPGRGYLIRKLRFEAVPGLSVPALLYEPQPAPAGRIPVVINLNGHDDAGVRGIDTQWRAINLAKKGLYALNVEWIGRGQLGAEGLQHDRMNQLDLVGTPGLAVFYESLRRTVDIALGLPHADPTRIAVTGLSGGGWQTILIGALDTRVTLVNPVAGHSSYVTRAQWPSLDLGDSEQTPSDLAAVADYTHLTALVAPRSLLLTYNANDPCCYRADYAAGPMVQSAAPIFGLLGASSRLAWNISHDTGHSYGVSSREAFYRFLHTHFFKGGHAFDPHDVDVVSELSNPVSLAVPLPPDTRDFRSLARRIAQGLVRSGRPTRDRLRSLLRVPQYEVRADASGGSEDAMLWKLRMAHWTVPLVEMTSSGARETTLLLADGGKASVGPAARALLASGQQVAALDPFYFGESALGDHDYLFALLVSALGERALGIQAGQVMAAARWLATKHGGPVEVVAYGPRTSLIAMVAAALEPGAIRAVRGHGAWSTLQEILDRDITTRQMPEMFPFGLLEEFDIDQLKQLIAPRPMIIDRLDPAPPG